VNLQELWDDIRAIPKGKVTSYGALGSRLKNPTSGYLVGKWMAACPEDVPWWRVVRKNGTLAIGNRDPNLEAEQRRRLTQEGVKIHEDCVDRAHLIEDW